VTISLGVLWPELERLEPRDPASAVN